VLQFYTKIREKEVKEILSRDAQ